MANTTASFFHLHLVSDSTGETLTTIAKAASVQYPQIRAIEHVYPLVRTERQLDRVLQEVQSAPGVVLYTIVDRELSSVLERRCRELQVPTLHVLDPIMKVFESYLGAPQTPVVAGQHTLDADYFPRIDGISRTSKTPTSIYLAQRGYKTSNVPLVPSVPLPQQLQQAGDVFVVGLVAAPDRISEIRRNRVRFLADRDMGSYVDREEIAREVRDSRRLFAKHGWPVIDVTRRSIEETAATIIKLYTDRQDSNSVGGESTGE